MAFTNPRVQRLRRLLGRRSARQDEGAFVVEGPLLVAEAVEAGLVDEVYVGPQARGLSFGDVPVVELADGVAERVATTVTPQPVLAVARRVERRLGPVGPDGFAVVAAGIADPGNLGTILRLAEASGATAIVLTPGSVDPFNPKVVRASAGSLFRVPVILDVSPGDLRAGLQAPLLGTVAQGGIPYDEAPLEPPVALVLGNEAHGIASSLELDGLVSIPHAGRAESLNVAMAAAVVCFEVARRLRRR